ncbi:MAG: hypothetical protein GY757_12025, partial [bacterium]|nr:hypothetical protein [bacterium]
NQDYQFDDLLEKLELTTEPGRHPLIDTVLTLQEIDSTPGEPAAETAREHSAENTYGFQRRTAKFELKMAATETPWGMTIRLEYRSRLFEHKTIEGMSKHFRNLLERVMENPDKKMSEIEMLGKEEMQQLMEIDHHQKKNETAAENNRREEEITEGDFDF